MADSGPGGEVSSAPEMSGYDERVERLARKLLHGGDGNGPAAQDIEAARRAARRILEESDGRTMQGYELEPEDDDVIRRSSSETASSGETSTPRTSTGE